MGNGCPGGMGLGDLGVGRARAGVICRDGETENEGTAEMRGGAHMGARDERQGLVEGAAVTPHLGPGEGPEETVGDTGGAGGLTITEQLLLSLRLSGWPSALSPTLSSGCRSPDIGEEESEESPASSPQPLHLSHTLPASSLITFPPTRSSLSL